MKPVLVINDFLVSDDVASAMRSALAAVPEGGARLVLRPGTYTIRGASCPRRFCPISNHDTGEYAVAFDFSGVRDVEFDGSGALFVCIGRVIPFWLEKCSGVSLRNFSIDWERPFFTEGRIVEFTAPRSVLLDIDRSTYPFAIVDGKFRFLGPDYESGYISNAMEIDSALREIGPTAKEPWGIREEHSAIERPDGLVELQAPFCSTLQPENILVLPHELRTSPTIVLTRASGVTLEDIHLYQSGGMGLIAQMSCDISVHRMIIKASPRRDCFTSLDGDATHFVECWGSVTLSECQFQGQMDDSSNVHGVYVPVVERVDDRYFMTKAGNHQQTWVDYFVPGEFITFVNPRTFKTHGRFLIESVERLDGEQCIYHTRERIPENVKGMAIGSAERRVNLLVENCRFEKHRCRGLLLSMPGHLHVRKNYFHLPGNGILMTSDCLDWFEAGPVDDVLIEENDFDHCAYGRRINPAAIRVGPNNGPNDTESSIVHRNITIRKNIFRGRLPFVSLHRAENVVIDDDNQFLADQGPASRDEIVVHSPWSQIP